MEPHVGDAPGPGFDLALSTLWAKVLANEGAERRRYERSHATTGRYAAYIKFLEEKVRAFPPGGAFGLELRFEDARYDDFDDMSDDESGEVAPPDLALSVVRVDRPQARALGPGRSGLFALFFGAGEPEEVVVLAEVRQVVYSVSGGAASVPEGNCKSPYVSAELVGAAKDAGGTLLSIRLSARHPFRLARVELSGAATRLEDRLTYDDCGAYDWAREQNVTLGPVDARGALTVRFLVE
mmetsp:Transcript_15765/g.47041  ORF Transcript_15765/g.47041 Transcript_15765/m.47041 type:complete len:239 (-) Transcript_15765:94-810(-)